MMKSKKKQYTKNEFSDEEVFNEIKDEIREIRDKNLKQLDEEMEIMKLYNDKKKDKKIKRFREKEGIKPSEERRFQRSRQGLGEEDEEEGEINGAEPMVDEKNQNQYEGVGIPTIREIGDHIRPITLTRNKVCNMLKSRKFTQIVKGCFVRYKAQGSGSNANSYLLAQIVGVTESQKEYFPNKSVRTKVLLRLQQSSQVIITLTIDHLSNQHPPGVLQIEKWLQTNRNKIPKQKQLKEKKEDLQNFIFGKISSEEIDKNIFEEAKMAAHGNEEIKTDISKLIYFMEGHLHDLKVNLDEIEDQKDKSEEFAKKTKEKQDCEEIMEILRQKRTNFFQQQRKKIKEEKQRSARKKYSQLLFEDRKEDRINDKNKQWLGNLYSHDGSVALIKEIQEAHKSFDLDISI